MHTTLGHCTGRGAARVGGNHGRDSSPSWLHVVGTVVMDYLIVPAAVLWET